MVLIMQEELRNTFSRHTVRSTREMEKLAVEGSFSVAASGSKHLDGKADQWSTQTVLTKEESEGVRLAANERQEMNGITTERQPTSTEAEGGFIMCEVE